MNRIPVVSLCLLAALPGWADDGIWLVNQFPKKRVLERYGFDVTDAFLERLRLGSVRLNNGGSGSFVSPRGLIFTNHHVASDCIQQLTTPQADLMKNGFWAAEQKDERACPDLEVNVLLAIEDVTAQVRTATQGAVAEANQKRKAAMTEIEKQCNANYAGQRCDVVTLYSGGLYHLYRYRKYTDIRLVFAPETAVAAFGGDPDNFMYPRYCLDFAFFRAYENGQPARVDNHLAWSKAGAREGELQFVSGHPGSTGRLATQSELEFNRDVSYPFLLDQLERLISALKQYGARGADEHRVSEENLTGQQNSFKAFTGFLSGLREPDLMARKRDEEKTLRAAAAEAGDPAIVAVWDQVAAAYREYAQFYKRYWLLETNAGRGSDLFGQARRLSRYTQEKTKPNGERLREYVDPALPAVEQTLYSTAPITASQEVAVLTNYFASLDREFGAGDALVRQVLAGRSASQAAEAYVSASKLADAGERKRLAVDAVATAQSGDSMLRLVRALDGEARALRKRFEDGVEATITDAAAKVAQIRFAKFGTNDYPDATFTLRVSYGPAKGYRNAAGVAVPWATDFTGMYRRATGVEPFALPKRWLDRKASLRSKTPYNYVTTTDTHGGNSGSPSVNIKGEVVGILFDGNIESLPNRFVYREQQERSVHVSSQSIVEALRSMYGARRLLIELGVAAK